MGLFSALLGGEPSYEDGFEAGRKTGIEDTLDAIEGASDPKKTGRYTGPVPTELREWCASIRARLEA